MSVRSTTMRAVTQGRYGDTSVLRVAHVPVPAPAAGRVLVRVAAAGLNMADWHLMTGKPVIARLVLGFRGPRSPIRGDDVAGTVVAVGEGVTRLAVGDRVFGSASGSFAEFVVAREELVVRIPEGVTDTEAAASPMIGYTALAALDAAGVERGTRVVVSGAGGGVGGAVVQLAHARGAVVTGVCSAGKAEAVLAFGADEVVDYRREDVTRRADRWDAVIDFAGDRTVSRWRRVLVPGGRLILGGGEGGSRIVGSLDRAVPGLVASIGRRLRVTTLVATASARGLERVAEHLEQGTLRPLVSRSYGLEEVPQAIDDLRSARFPGKLAIVP
jgi:NADPH:quinone reductase-like Zn-dependent oxidoreductase